MRGGLQWRTHARRTRLDGGLVRGRLDGGLMHGGLGARERRVPGGLGSRRRTRLSTAGSTLDVGLTSHLVAVVRWDRRWQLTRSGAWPLAFDSTSPRRCCWILRMVIGVVTSLVVVESPSSLVHALFRSFSRQIWQPSRWGCDVSLQRWCFLAECFGPRRALALILFRGLQGPFGVAVLGASMVGVPTGTAG
jgi:hypothetical protein